MNWIRKTLMMAMCLLAMMAISLGQVLEEVPNENKGPGNPDHYNKGFFLALAVPVATLNIDLGHQNMKALLEGDGLAFPNMVPSTAIGIGGYLGRFYGRAGMNYSLGQSGRDFFADQGRSLRRGLDEISLQLGLAIWQTRNVSLIAWAGAGFLSSSVVIQDYRGINSVDLNEITEGGLRTGWPILYHESGVIDLSLEYQAGRPKNRTSLNESIRVGYRFGWQEEPWRLESGNLSTPLTDRVSQLYVQINFNIGFNFID